MFAPSSVGALRSARRIWSALIDFKSGVQGLHRSQYQLPGVQGDFVSSVFFSFSHRASCKSGVQEYGFAPTEF